MHKSSSDGNISSDPNGNLQSRYKCRPLAETYRSDPKEKIGKSLNKIQAVKL
jgi:hypothetical protein